MDYVTNRPNIDMVVKKHDLVTSHRQYSHVVEVGMAAVVVNAFKIRK